MAGTSPALTERVLFRRELYFRRGGADFSVNLRFELGKILLEHADQRARGLVELGLVGPRLDRVEDMRLDAGQRGRYREAEIFVGAEIGVAQRAVQRGRQERPRHLDGHAAPGAVFAASPAGVDQPTIDTVLGDQVAHSGCGSLPSPRSVPATLAV